MRMRGAGEEGGGRENTQGKSGPLHTKQRGRPPSLAVGFGLQAPGPWGRTYLLSKAPQPVALGLWPPCHTSRISRALDFAGFNMFPTSLLSLEASS